MSAFRPLPPRPNIEHVRKEAKALLRRLRRGDPEAVALARTRHAAFDTGDPTRARLADAQLITAREYGFTSWPRLVRYFADLERQQYGYHQLHGGPQSFEHTARSILNNHAKGRPWATRALAAYVPRFYGLGIPGLSGAEVTEEEARLATARMNGAPSWEVLLEKLAHNARNRPDLWEVDRAREAWDAIRDGDIDKLSRVVAEQPQLLDPSEYDISANSTLMVSALGKERREGRKAARPIIEWLEARGFNRQLELNRMLRGPMRFQPDEVRALLDQGADPDWVEPSGIPIFEIALLRYWNRDAVDLLAARTTPRKAFWIAAALGDLEGLGRFFGRDGSLKAVARDLRPDWVAAGWPGVTALPEPDDDELLLEALNVAMFNGRGAAIEYLAARGAPLNSLAYSQPLLNLAVGNGWEEAAESLIRAGANLDVRGWHPDTSPREAARMLLKRDSENPKHRRIAALCGLDVEGIIAEIAAAPAKEPEITPEVTRALEAASIDAARVGQAAVSPENLLMGLLQTFSPAVHILRESGFQVDRFRADRADRFSTTDSGPSGTKLPLDEEGRALMEAVIAVAREKSRPVATGHHLLIALIGATGGPVDRLLRSYGVDTAKVNDRLCP